MAQWRIKEISELTNISIRMLRHYDKIGLLKPSSRSQNQYRWYSEADLASLQQIVALRYFGFSLNAIADMLQKKHTIHAHLQAQQQMIKGQAQHLHEVDKALSDILARVPPSGIPNSSDLITLIERYHMTQDLKKTWAGQTLSESQFADYVAIYEKHPKDYAAWDKIIAQINNGEFGDPEGPDGERVIEFQLEILKKTKDTLSEQRHLGSEILADIKSGRISTLQLSPEGGLWLSRASLSYWLKQWESIYDAIVANLSADPAGPQGSMIAGRWRDLVDLMLSTSPRDLAIGTMLWQVLAQQKIELEKAKEPPTPQDLVKKVYVKLIFNPDAMKWIEGALLAHPSRS